MKKIIILTAVLSSSTVMAQWQALPETAPAPANNPTTTEKVELGKALFFDPRISSTGTVSCNSCHNVMAGGDDNRATSMGIEGKLGGRSAPTVWNAAFYSTQFWDGRANTLEDQAIGPMTNPIEMGMKDHDTVMQRLQTIPGYKTLFNKAFGNTDMTIDQAAKAIAAYERTLITPNSAYDKFVKGNKKALTSQQQKGMKLFAETGCTACHSGPAFNGQQDVKIGTPVLTKFPTFENNAFVKKYDLKADIGRQEVTGKAADAHMFRTPTLRNIALTAPYFHNGKVGNLNTAVKVMAKTQLNRDLKKNEVEEIVAFLNSLSGDFPAQTMPRLPITSGSTLLK
jgi:cytochrome c peroxidase